MENMGRRSMNEDIARLSLHAKFCEILNNENVYFQPPESIKMRYPAIRYSLENIVSTYADNLVYGSRKRYIVTLIDADPDSIYVDTLTRLKTSRFVRSYQKDGLNHFVFIIYY